MSHNVQTAGTLARGNSLEANKSCFLRPEVFGAVRCAASGHQTHMDDSASASSWDLEPMCVAKPRSLREGSSEKIGFFPAPVSAGSPMTLIKPTCYHWSIRRITITHTFSLFVLLPLSKAHLHSSKVTRICHS